MQESGAELVIAPCHNCRDQIMKSLNKEYDLGIEVKYLWELVADCLDLSQAVKNSSEMKEDGVREAAVALLVQEFTEMDISVTLSELT